MYPIFVKIFDELVIRRRSKIWGYKIRFNTPSLSTVIRDLPLEIYHKLALPFLFVSLSPFVLHNHVILDTWISGAPLSFSLGWPLPISRDGSAVFFRLLQTCLMVTRIVPRSSPQWDARRAALQGPGARGPGPFALVGLRGGRHRPRKAPRCPHGAATHGWFYPGSILCAMAQLCRSASVCMLILVWMFYALCLSMGEGFCSSEGVYFFCVSPTIILLSGFH